MVSLLCFPPKLLRKRFIKCQLFLQRTHGPLWPPLWPPLRSIPWLQAQAANSFVHSMAQLPQLRLQRHSTSVHLGTSHGTSVITALFSHLWALDSCNILSATCTSSAHLLLRSRNRYLNPGSVMTCHDPTSPKYFRPILRPILRPISCSKVFGVCEPLSLRQSQQVELELSCLALASKLQEITRATDRSNQIN